MLHKYLKEPYYRSEILVLKEKVLEKNSFGECSALAAVCCTSIVLRKLLCNIMSFVRSRRVRLNEKVLKWNFFLSAEKREKGNGMLV